MYFRENRIFEKDRHLKLRASSIKQIFSCENQHSKLDLKHSIFDSTYLNIRILILEYNKTKAFLSKSKWNISFQSKS